MTRVLAVGGLVVAGWGVRRYLGSRDAMAAAATDLRNPVLAFTSFSFSPRTLSLIRALFSINTRPGPGVTLTKHRIGNPAVPVLVMKPSEPASSVPAVLWIHGGGMVVGTPQFEAGQW